MRHGPAPSNEINFSFDYSFIRALAADVQNLFDFKNNTNDRRQEIK